MINCSLMIAIEFTLTPLQKYSHARHHRYTNHMEKDTAFVPAKKDDNQIMTKVQEKVKHIFHMTEDAPIVSLLFLIGHQLIGWQAYMLFYASSGYKSLALSKDPRTTSNLSHYSPMSPIYLPSQRLAILVSDLGLLAVGYGLYYATQVMGLTQVALLYGLPYLWVNHWLGEFYCAWIASEQFSNALQLPSLTFTTTTAMPSTSSRALGHSRRVPWPLLTETSDLLAASCSTVSLSSTLSTIFSRKFRRLHNLLEATKLTPYSRIPFYHAEEATGAIQPMLGKKYIRDNTSFLKALWKNFTSHHYVVEHETKPGTLVWAK